MFIAKQRRYFAAEHIDLEIKIVDAAQAAAPAVAVRDADFGVTAFTGAVFNLALKTESSSPQLSRRDVAVRLRLVGKQLGLTLVYALQPLGLKRSER